MPPNVVPSLVLTCLISVKAGELVNASGDVSLRLTVPGGKIHDYPDKYPVLLKGRHQSGHSIVVSLTLAALAGNHAVDALWNGVQFAHIPFRMEVRPTEAPAE